MSPFEFVSEERWLKFIASSDCATIFHHPRWLKVLQRQYGLEGSYLCEIDHTGHIRGGLPVICESKGGSTLLRSLPFTDYIRPVVNDPVVERQFQAELGEYVVQKRYSAEFRWTYSAPNFERMHVGYLHRTSLETPSDELFSSLRKTRVQQRITKALDYGLTASISEEYADVEEFYRLHLLTRRKLGIPVQPKRFFKILYEEVLAKRFGFLSVVRKGRVPVSIGVLAGFGKTLTYKFSASDQKYLSYKPNNLMLWSAMLEAQARGFTVFDFGRTELGNDGLRRFKLGWRSVEEPLNYSYFLRSPKGKTFSFLKERFVSPLIRYSPTFVCRLSGELLYRFFG